MIDLKPVIIAIGNIMPLFIARKILQPVAFKTMLVYIPFAQ